MVVTTVEATEQIEEDERVEAYVHWVQKDSIAQMLWENVPGAVVQPQRDGPRVADHDARLKKYGHESI